jgi:hypothetical protein
MASAITYYQKLVKTARVHTTIIRKKETRPCQSNQGLIVEKLSPPLATLRLRKRFSNNNACRKGTMHNNNH